MDLPCPRGSIHPAIRGGVSEPHTLSTSSTCHGRNTNGINAPLPFGTTMYCFANAATRRPPTARDRNGNGDGSGDDLGPALTGEP